MANNISDTINKIFSEEIYKNRNLTLTKHNVSNKLIRNKLSKVQQDNYELIKNFNKRQSGPETLFKEKKKFINENNDNDIIFKKNKNKNNFIKIENNFNSTIKKILKKDNSKGENNYYIDNKFYINENVLNRKKTKKAKFNLVENNKEKENNIEELKTNEKKLKRNRTNTKRNLKNIIMIEKQKYPKKETVFDRIKGNIKESNNEIYNDDNISLKKRQKKGTHLKPKRPYINSIKTLDSKFKLYNSIKLKKNTNMINNINGKRISGDNNSSNFLKMNMDNNNDSNNSNEKTIKTNKSEKTKKSKNKLKIDDKDKESNFFESSKFSEESGNNKENKDSNNNKENIFINKNSNNKNKLKNGQGSSSYKNNNSNRSRKKNENNKNTNNIIIYDNQSNEEDNKSQNNNKYSSELSDFDDKEKGSDNDNDNIENKNNNDSDIENSTKKQIEYKYIKREEEALSIIPEQDNKKKFSEDINQNIEIIKPENLICLENNLNKNKKRNSKNVEIQKNNIIINNNISNNITVHKKESELKQDDIKIEEEEDENKKNKEHNRKGKSYKVKVRKKFPFCCL